MLARLGRLLTARNVLTACVATCVGCTAEKGAGSPLAPRESAATDIADGPLFGDTVIVLGAPNGQRNSDARDVNDKGQIVGDAQVNSQTYHAVRWNCDGTLTDLGAFAPDASSFAWGISSDGLVVGQSSTSSGERHAFSWTDRGGMVDLEPLPGGHESGAFRPSHSGVIPGYSLTAEMEQHAVVWGPSGIEDLGVLSKDSPSAAALGANDAGVVVGVSTPGPFRAQHAFKWTRATGMMDLGTLGGDRSAAYSVNALGDVVGESSTGTGETHAVIWKADGQTIDLGTLPTGVRSFARDINDQGQVVGIATIEWSDGRQVDRAFIWTRQMGMRQLIASDPKNVGALNNAWGINNSGLVVGEVELNAGGVGAALWPAVGSGHSCQ